MPISKGPAGVHEAMTEFKNHEMHSGSKTGPVVKKRKQAIAIALHQAGMSRDQQKPAKRNSLRRRG